MAKRTVSMAYNIEICPTANIISIEPYKPNEDELQETHTKIETTEPGMEIYRLQVY